MNIPQCVIDRIVNTVTRPAQCFVCQRVLDHANERCHQCHPKCPLCHGHNTNRSHAGQGLCWTCHGKYFWPQPTLVVKDKPDSKGWWWHKQETLWKIVQVDLDSNHYWWRGEDERYRWHLVDGGQWIKVEEPAI